jgi:hypothetical protein
VAYRDFLFTQTNVSHLLIEKLSDGTTAILDTNSKSVYSLNASAAAAFEACRGTVSAAQVAETMQSILGTPVTEDLALAAIAQLEEHGLASSSVPEDVASVASRRSLLKRIGAVGGAAVPVVLALTAAEQRASAFQQGSGTTTTTTTTTTTSVPPPPA